MALPFSQNIFIPLVTHAAFPEILHIFTCCHCTEYRWCNTVSITIEMFSQIYEGMVIQSVKKINSKCYSYVVNIGIAVPRSGVTKVSIIWHEHPFSQDMLYFVFFKQICWSLCAGLEWGWYCFMNDNFITLCIIVNNKQKRLSYWTDILWKLRAVPAHRLGHPWIEENSNPLYWRRRYKLRSRRNVRVDSFS